MGVSVAWPLSVLWVFVCVCVCVISNQSTSKNPYYVSNHSKLDTLLHKTHIKVLLVLRYQGSTCVGPLSKIAHQMWHSYPFSQRNRTKERTEGLGVGEGWEVVVLVGGGGGVGQNLNYEDRNQESRLS